MEILFATADEAEEAFYTAFARADIEGMMQVWAEQETVHCTHPLSPRIEGREAIRESFSAIFADPVRMDIRLKGVRRVQDSLLAIHMLQEHFVAAGADRPFTPMAATNIYQLTESGWRMIAHHASPVEPPRKIAHSSSQDSATVH
jgi:uncharacterized protein (TIGR02246 family)